MRPVYRGPVPAYQGSRGSYAQVSEEYGFYMKSLIQRLGEYCSYCEVPLGANLAVEHIISKSSAPQYETTWNNFVLACPNCNSTKSDNVTVSNINDYYWPSDTSYDTFSKYTYAKDLNGYVVLTPVDTRATNTIALMGLNKYNTADNGKLSDRRVFNRTSTWNAAEDLAAKLDAYYIGAGADNLPPVILLKRQIKLAAVASGFWSVWMTVFGARTFYDTTTKNDLLCELFVQTFPGTNYPIGICPDNVPSSYHGGLPV